MANKLFDQVSGIIGVALNGKGQEKIINMALTRGIYIWDIKKDGDKMTFKVRATGFNALQAICEENNFDLEVTDKKGFPYLKIVLKRRMGFITGALLFIMALYLMSSFIWFIEVSGNKNVDENRIILLAAKHGVYKGAAKWNFSKTEVEEGMLRSIPELTYIQLDIRGVKTNIKVVEKILPDKDITGPCHIVASKDGIVEEILVLEGEANVKTGDVVARGDILISGVIFPSEQPFFIPNPEEPPVAQEPYTVRARGTVKARVWYEGYGECNMRTESDVISGKEAKSLYVQTPWRNIYLTGKRKVGFPEAEQTVRKNIVNTPLGEFGLYRITIKEKIKEVVEYTEQEAITIAKDKAMDELNRKMESAGKIEDTQIQILSAPSDSILRIKVTVEVIENIALPEPINETEK